MLAVAASLNGGNALAQLAAATLPLVRAVAPSVGPDEVVRAVFALAACGNPATLRVVPTFRGERHDVGASGAILDLTPASFHVANVAAATAWAALQNVVAMVPEGVLRRVGRVVLCGGGIAELPFAAAALRALLPGREVVRADEGDSAAGAALAAAQIP